MLLKMHCPSNNQEGFIGIVTALFFSLQMKRIERFPKERFGIVIKFFLLLLKHTYYIKGHEFES